MQDMDKNGAFYFTIRLIEDTLPEKRVSFPHSCSEEEIIVANIDFIKGSPLIDLFCEAMGIKVSADRIRKRLLEKNYQRLREIHEEN